MKRKLVAIATATLCMAGSMNLSVFAASKFADINDVPWAGAAQYIDEAAELGLMAGYTENGKVLYKAKNSVTYCEAVQMMYSIMSSNDSSQKASSSVISKWQTTMQGAGIPEWAYESVAYGLENSILSTNDIKIFVSSGKQSSARREDVAVIFGKALAKKYPVNVNGTLTYGDKGSVSSTSVPYLELLNRLNLMVGDSSNNFNPKANINRAEMAVLMTKSYNKLKENSGSNNNNNNNTTKPNVEQFSGTVTSVSESGKDVVIKVNVSGSSKEFTVSSSASVIKEDKASSASKISENDTVVIVMNDSKVTFVTILSSSNASDSSKLSGAISSITTKKISIKNDSSTTSYSFEKRYENIVVKLDGSSSDVDDLIKAYKDGDNLSAKLTVDSEGYVTRIDATTEENQLSGTLTSVSSSKVAIKYDGKTYSYNVPDDSDDVNVTINGSSSTFSKLKSNYSSTTYTVKITLDKDKEITKIVATGKNSDSSSSSVSGELYSVSKSKIKIVKSDDSKKEYDVSSDVTVTIDGSSSKIATLISKFDSDKDYDVKLTLSDDEVTKIVATTSDGTTSDSAKGTLVDVDEDDGIRVKVSGKTTWYPWATSGYEIKLNGGLSNISKLNSKMSSETVTVTLSLNGAGRVTKVIATSSDDDDSSDLEGTITSLSSNKITIKLDNGNKKNYDLDDDVTVTIDGSSKTLSKLKNAINDDDETYSVVLTLNKSGDVSKIKASQSKGTISGYVWSIDDDGMKLKENVKDKVSVSCYFAGSVTVKVDGDSMDLDDFIKKASVENKYYVEVTKNGDNKVTKIVAEEK